MNTLRTRVCSDKAGYIDGLIGASSDPYEIASETVRRCVKGIKGRLKAGEQFMITIDSVWLDARKFPRK